ncbi:MAG: DUF1566 domain-containing protein [Deltaproteobacteria bacterium]|nr:DUF1566 domain-containing protein [Deltaproteobacteria bacterium]
MALLALGLLDGCILWHRSTCISGCEALDQDTTDTAAEGFRVGGTVVGLVGSIVVQINGGETVTLSGESPFVFPTALSAGDAYSVTVADASLNPDQDCSVSASAGTVGDSDVVNIVVSCVCKGCRSELVAGSCTAAANASSVCQTGHVFWADSCGIVTGPKELCGFGQVCANAACCSPSCTNKCGGASDGCGGACTGSCGQGKVCQAQSCVSCGGYAEACCESDACNGGLTCNSATCVADTCAGKNNFTLCKVVTASDRSYDICVGGACVSPGCGDQSCNPPGPHFPLGDSGQRTCYGLDFDSGPVACAGIGEDAEFGWDTSHVDSERFARLSEEESTVVDATTGLVWQGCIAGLRGASCETGSASLLTWSDALAYCDGLAWGGVADWRVPDRFEIQSIIHHDSLPPRVGASFPGTPSLSYWTISVPDSVKASRVDLAGGVLAIDSVRYTAYGVRCVRGGFSASLPATRFSRTEPVPGETIVHDAVTGLMWTGCVMAGENGSGCNGGGLVNTWSGSMYICAGHSWAGFSDWRLPNIVEIASILDDKQPATPKIDGAYFPNTPGGCTITSTADSNYPYSPWAINFQTGTWTYGVKNADSCYSRCVRSAF